MRDISSQGIQRQKCMLSPTSGPHYSAHGKPVILPEDADGKGGGQSANSVGVGVWCWCEELEKCLFTLHTRRTDEILAVSVRNQHKSKETKPRNAWLGHVRRDTKKQTNKQTSKQS